MEVPSTERRMGYTRIETERAGRHLPRPYRGREIGAAYDAGMPDAMVEPVRTQRRGWMIAEESAEGADSEGVIRLSPSPHKNKADLAANMRPKGTMKSERTAQKQIKSEKMRENLQICKKKCNFAANFEYGGVKSEE